VIDARRKSIILISDDAEELIGMADRILVFRGGRIAASVKRAHFSRETLLLAAAHGSGVQDATEGVA